MSLGGEEANNPRLHKEIDRLIDWITNEKIKTITFVFSYSDIIIQGKFCIGMRKNGGTDFLVIEKDELRIELHHGG